MNYKLLAIDLDDTLLNDDLNIGNENVKALEYAHKRGVKIVLATGRSINSVLPYIESLKIVNMNDYHISFNGAIISNRKGNILFEKILDQSVLLDLIQTGRENNIGMQLYSMSELLVEEFTDEVKDYERITGIVASKVTDLTKIPTSIKMIYNQKDIPRLDNLKKILIDRYGDELNIFYSKPTYLEVLAKAANKGLALKYLATHLNIQREEIIAVGDSFNDISMIEYAGLGVCMKNGKREVMERADYVTSNTNNESGIAEIIYKFM